MRDIGQNFYETKEYYFNNLSVSKIIINPAVRGYPPLFLVCTGTFGSKKGSYVLALSFLQINKLLMGSLDNSERLDVAAKLAEFLIPNEHSGEICLRKALGTDLKITDVDLTTRVHRFNSDESTEGEALYYFQLIEM